MSKESRNSDEHRIRIPELAIGVLIVAACVLGALMWQRSMEKGTAVLIAGQDLERGQIITEDDLSAVVVSSDRPLRLLRSTAAPQVIGMRVLVDVPSGTPINSTQIADVEPVDARHGLVGITVTSDKAPLDLMAGDSVQVVSVDDSVDGTRRVEILDMVATIWATTAVEDVNDQRAVTLRVPIAASSLIQGHDELHLVKVGS